MLFKPELAEKIIREEKTQTRRVVTAGDVELVKPKITDHIFFERDKMYLYHRADETREITAVERNGRKLWNIGSDYAVCPGRGKRQVARIRITDIRQECVQDITEADALAEGFASRDEFLATFKKINPKSGLDTSVWVLSFQLVK